jgi:hypothetical protein
MSSQGRFDAVGCAHEVLAHSVVPSHRRNTAIRSNGVSCARRRSVAFAVYGDASFRAVLDDRDLDHVRHGTVVFPGDGVKRFRTAQ